MLSSLASWQADNLATTHRTRARPRRRRSGRAGGWECRRSRGPTRRPRSIFVRHLTGGSHGRRASLRRSEYRERGPQGVRDGVTVHANPRPSQPGRSRSRLVRQQRNPPAGHGAIHPDVLKQFFSVVTACEQTQMMLHAHRINSQAQPTGHEARGSTRGSVLLDSTTSTPSRPGQPPHDPESQHPSPNGYDRPNSSTARRTSSLAYIHNADKDN
jgi:hypothetical protein